MDYTHLVGVDPGLVHTGMVSMVFDPKAKHIAVQHEVIDGIDDKACAKVAGWKRAGARGFIEGYRPRNNLSSDRRMTDGVSRMRVATGFKVLDNMGVKKIITPGIMQALGVWSFSTVTHHQDLRSAARIALLGLIKTDDGNRLVSDIIRDHLDGSPWTITT